MLLDHRFALTHREAREGEHSDLGGDVRPVTWHASALNGTAQRGSHVVHPGADNDELIKPLSTHLRVVENGGGLKRRDAKIAEYRQGVFCVTCPNHTWFVDKWAYNCPVVFFGTRRNLWHTLWRPPTSGPF